MKTFVTALLPAAVLVAACSSAPVSSTASSSYWRPTSTGAYQFPNDHAACSVRTSRLANVTTPPPENRLDRPMQKWSSAQAQEIYEGCMAERGWRSAG